MKNQPLLLLALAAAATSGCSGRFDVTTENRTPSETVEKFHTSVGIDVLTEREEAPESSPEKPSGLSETIVRAVEVEVDGDGNIVVVIEGDIHEHPRQKAAAKKPESGWNTKIGWPTQLRRASSWTVSCYVAVWGLVVAAIALMIDNLKRTEGGPLFGVVMMLGTASVLLQFLPHTESGIQFVPISPWSYAGWESFFVSLSCWAVILFAGFVAIDRSPDSPQAFAILCLIAISLNVLLSFSTLKENSALRSQAAAYQQVEVRSYRRDYAHLFRRGRPEGREDCYRSCSEVG